MITLAAALITTIGFSTASFANCECDGGTDGWYPPLYQFCIYIFGYGTTCWVS